MKKILIDTDIGDDIDDALAIAYALNSKSIEVVGITTAFEMWKPAVNWLCSSLAFLAIPIFLYLKGLESLLSNRLMLKTRQSTRILPLPRMS